MWRRKVFCIPRTCNSIVKPFKYTITDSRIASPCALLINNTNGIHNLTLTKYSPISNKSLQSIHTKHNISASESQDINAFTCRTHTCGELRPCHIGQKVTLCGWVQYLRLSKFLLLRDGYGLTQCIVSGGKDLSNIPLETVVKIIGTVSMRPKDMINQNMLTGDIEVVISDIEILNTVDKLPFNLRDYQKPKEQLRMQHRYIDLRFPEMQYNLRQRSLMLHGMRRLLVEKFGFVEVETPTLFCRTPGGAKEFVVPTHHSELFYSLVQSPQQFKQMLMSGGIDRYYQVARCYRDEMTRPNRQPEFTQLDIELSFTNVEGVLNLIEELLCETYTDELPKPPFKRLTYREALEVYGSDKPNTTYEMKLINITKLFPNKLNDNSFGAYCIPYPKELGKLTSKSKDFIRQLTKKYHTKVILNENISKELGQSMSLQLKDVVSQQNSCLIALGNKDNSCLCLGEIRVMLAQLLSSKNLIHINQKTYPLWVVDFPLFLKDENGNLETCHHPFTSPHPDDLSLLETAPEKVRSLAYDLVINGNEVGGGSVRVHNVELQEKILSMLRLELEPLTHFLNALRCGCPPHAGIALGIDRLMALACNANSIRDVIAFPKSHDGKDPLSGAPNRISEDDKKYYHLT